MAAEPGDSAVLADAAVATAGLQVNATYGLGGSMFDSRAVRAPRRDADQARLPPADLLDDARRPAEDSAASTTARIARPSTSATPGGRNGNLFDQYATVPSEAYRPGDFSASPAAIIDPLTGQPFPGNQIPSRPDQRGGAGAAAVHSQREPVGRHAQLPSSDTTHSTTDSVQPAHHAQLTPPQAGRGGRGGGRGGAAGGAGAQRVRPRATGTQPGARGRRASGRRTRDSHTAGQHQAASDGRDRRRQQRAGRGGPAVAPGRPARRSRRPRQLPAAAQRHDERDDQLPPQRRRSAERVSRC